MRILLLLVTLLTGCSSEPIKLAYNCPIINLPPDPIWQTKLLTAKSTASTVVKSFPADLGSCRTVDNAMRVQIQTINAANQAGGY